MIDCPCSKCNSKPSVHGIWKQVVQFENSFQKPYCQHSKSSLQLIDYRFPGFQKDANIIGRATHETRVRVIAQMKSRAKKNGVQQLPIRCSASVELTIKPCRLVGGIPNVSSKQRVN